MELRHRQGACLRRARILEGGMGAGALAQAASDAVIAFLLLPAWANAAISAARLYVR
jgi:hypothetical protein